MTMNVHLFFSQVASFRKSQRRVFDALFVFTAALSVRLLYILTVGWHYTPIFDAGIYDAIAHHLLNNGCYCVHGSSSSVSRAPLWPWILAGIYSLSDQHVLFAQLFYALLGSTTCLILYSLSATLFTPKTALITGTIAANLYWIISL